MTNTATHTSTTVPAYLDRAGNPHLDANCAEAVQPIVQVIGLGYGFPCNCCDDFLAAQFGTGAALRARAAGVSDTERTYGNGDGSGRGNGPALASDKQVAFYTRLVRERIVEAGHAALIAAAPTMTGKAMSKAIDSLLSLPVLTMDVVKFTKVGSDWAVKGNAATLVPGATVTVTKSNGDTTTVLVGTVVHTANSSATALVATAPRVQAPAADMPAVPAGHYAYPLPGHPEDREYIVHVRVDVTDDGRTFVKRILGGRPASNLATRAAMVKALEAITAYGIAESAVLYGNTTERCCRCNRHLTDQDSVAAGIGPECATK
jgi:hypothetical protein